MEGLENTLQKGFVVKIGSGQLLQAVPSSRVSSPDLPDHQVILVKSEFEFLESTTKKIILAKDTSGSFFA